MYVKNPSNDNIKTIRSDNYKEFDCGELYEKLVIIFQRTYVKTLQKNSIIERKQGHILNVTRNLFFQSSISKMYCSYVVSHVIHLINRLPSLFFNRKSSYEMLYDQLLTRINSKVFGYIYFCFHIKNNRIKLNL